MYFNNYNIDYQLFAYVKLSTFSLLRYLTDFNDIPLMMADRIL